MTLKEGDSRQPIRLFLHAVQLGSCRRPGSWQPFQGAARQGTSGLISQHCPPEVLLPPKRNQKRLHASQSSSGHLLSQSYFYISFPHIMAIYILQQSTLVSKTQTRNNNTLPGASQEPQPRGGFGNQGLKQVVPSFRVGEFSATLDNKWP